MAIVLFLTYLTYKINFWKFQKHYIKAFLHHTITILYYIILLLFLLQITIAKY